MSSVTSGNTSGVTTSASYKMATLPPLVTSEGRRINGSKRHLKIIADDSRNSCPAVRPREGCGMEHAVVCCEVLLSVRHRPASRYSCICGSRWVHSVGDLVPYNAPDHRTGLCASCEPAIAANQAGIDHWRDTAYSQRRHWRCSPEDQSIVPLAVRNWAVSQFDAEIRIEIDVGHACSTR